MSQQQRDGSPATNDPSLAAPPPQSISSSSGSNPFASPGISFLAPGNPFSTSSTNGGFDGATFTFGDHLRISPAALARQAIRKKQTTAVTWRPEQDDVRRDLTTAPHFGDSFSVLAGPADNPTPFNMHEGLVSEQSGFFARIFSNDWKERGDRIVRLPECQFAHFQLFFLWTYKSRIFSHISDPKSTSASDNEWNTLAEAWVLGDYLEAIDFKNAIVDALIAKASQGTWAFQQMHEIIYAKTPANAPIRKLLVDIAAYMWDSAWTKALPVNSASVEFFRDLSAAAISRATKSENGPEAIKSKWKTDRHLYHEHVKVGKPCYGSKMVA